MDTTTGCSTAIIDEQLSIRYKFRRLRFRQDVKYLDPRTQVGKGRGSVCTPGRNCQLRIEQEYPCFPNASRF